MATRARLPALLRPSRGKQQTLVLFDEWLPSAKRLLREAALAELARRYFTGHGPATLADFAWWSGLRVADARLAVDLAGNRIEETTIDGQSLWFNRSTPSSPTSRARAYILPAFDEFLVAYTERTAAIESSRMVRVNAGGGIINPTIVVDGRIVGTRKRRVERREVVLALAPFEPLNKSSTEAVTLALER